MGLHTFRHCLATVPPDVEISFAGYSEPWLDPDCTAMVEHAAAKGHAIRIFTTLVEMTQDDLQRLRTLPINLFVVHAFDDGTYMKLRFVTEAYLELVHSVLKAGLPSLRFLVFGSLHPSLATAIPADLVVRTRPLISRAGNVNPAIVPKPDAIAGPIRCREGREYRNVLLPNGDVTLCCMDYLRRHVLGNLLVDEYSTLHTGDAFQTVLTRMGGDEGFLLCRTCEYSETGY
jgi:hypothetical protein